MKRIETPIEGLFVLAPATFVDRRGFLTKIYDAGIFDAWRLRCDFKESYYSSSRKDVIRGMHFQYPPFDHDKLVNVPCGRALDVVLDLRKSKGKKRDTFGLFFFTVLSAENRRALHIPAGLAHGFLSLEENTLMLYHQTTVHAPEHDGGVRYDSFGFEWPVASPVLSERDRAFGAFADFDTPFVS